MLTLHEIETQAMGFPEADRALLASHLLGSLSAVLTEADEGISEALRRDAELDQDPSAAMTWDELKRSVKSE